MPDDANWDELRKRLNVIIQLLLEMTPSGAESTTRKIEKLLDLGLSKSEVANVIGKKVNYVTAVTSAKKRSRSRKRGES